MVKISKPAETLQEKELRKKIQKRWELKQKGGEEEEFQNDPNDISSDHDLKMEIRQELPDVVNLGKQVLQTHFNMEKMTQNAFEIN